MTHHVYAHQFLGKRPTRLTQRVSRANKTSDITRKKDVVPATPIEIFGLGDPQVNGKITRGSKSFSWCGPKVASHVILRHGSFDLDFKIYSQGIRIMGLGGNFFFFLFRKQGFGVGFVGRRWENFLNASSDMPHLPDSLKHKGTRATVKLLEISLTHLSALTQMWILSFASPGEYYPK